MERNDSMTPIDSHQENKSIISIIGIGGEACRIADKIQVYNYPHVSLYAFGMNRQDIGELTLPNKYLIGTEGLESGKDRSYAASECRKIKQSLDKVINRFLSIFIVCLGDDTDEGCIRTFLQKAAEMNTRAKLLVISLPHSSEGIEKRKNAIHLLENLEQLVDSIFVVDYNSMPCNTESELFEEGNRRVIEFVDTVISSIVKVNIIDFDLNDLVAFIRYNSNSRYIEHISFSGDINNLQQVSQGLHKHISSKCSSFNAISYMVLSVAYHSHTEDNSFRQLLDRILLPIMLSLNEETNVKWTMYHDPSMEKNFYRLNILTKCNSNYTNQ